MFLPTTIHVPAAINLNTKTDVTFSLQADYRVELDRGYPGPVPDPSPSWWPHHLHWPQDLHCVWLHPLRGPGQVSLQLLLRRGPPMDHHGSQTQYGTCLWQIYRKFAMHSTFSVFASSSGEGTTVYRYRVYTTDDRGLIFIACQILPVDKIMT